MSAMLFQQQQAAPELLGTVKQQQYHDVSWCIMNAIPWFLTATSNITQTTPLPHVVLVNLVRQE